MPSWYKDSEKLGGFKAAVRDLMADKGWHSTMELLAIGGANGTRRLRELKEYGFDYEKRRKEGSEEFEYRLTRAPKLG
jgi:hypothetical protein